MVIQIYHKPDFITSILIFTFQKTKRKKQKNNQNMTFRDLVYYDIHVQF
jgi:hypothetical protein